MIDTETTLEDVRTEISCKNGELTVNRVQDVEPILEANKAAMSNAPSWRPYAGSNLRHVASIPLVVAEQWLKEGLDIIGPASKTPEMRRKLAQKLNSNEYAYLRTYPGQVGW